MGRESGWITAAALAIAAVENAIGFVPEFRNTLEGIIRYLDELINNTGLPPVIVVGEGFTFQSSDPLFDIMRDILPDLKVRMSRSAKSDDDGYAKISGVRRTMTSILQTFYAKESGWDKVLPDSFDIGFMMRGLPPLDHDRMMARTMAILLRMAAERGESNVAATLDDDVQPTIDNARLVQIKDLIHPKKLTYQMNNRRLREDLDLEVIGIALNQPATSVRYFSRRSR